MHIVTTTQSIMTVLMPFFFEGVGGGGLLYLFLSTIAFRLEKHFEKFSSLRFHPTPPSTIFFVPCQKVMRGVGLFMEL